jgi:hypothetical protein
MRQWASIAARQNDQRTSDKVIAFFAVLNTSDIGETNQSIHRTGSGQGMTMSDVQVGVDGLSCGFRARSVRA